MPSQKKTAKKYDSQDFAALGDVANGLEAVLSAFKSHFYTRTHPVFHKAMCYVRGLFKCEKNRANCQSISQTVGELDSQSLTHLLSESPWDEREVLDELGLKSSALLDAGQEVGLLVDEVGIRKKGRHSACVSNQYLGCIGKNDNGQVAVVCCLSQGAHYFPVDVALFMPKSWEGDWHRRAKARIPVEVCHRTKPQMALEMVKGAKSRGLSFDYVAFDALYGSSLGLLESLDSEGTRFIGDANGNVRIWEREPKISLPEKPKNAYGRKPNRPKADHAPRKLSQYAESLNLEADFESIAFRQGTKQKVRAKFHFKHVWVWPDKKRGVALPLLLAIRKDQDGKTKYSLCNMQGDSLKKIAARQGQRVFVERVFEEGKNQVGLADYQVRSWGGFHKHMALCFLAIYYMAYQKAQHHHTLTLTAPIIRKLVAATIISKWESLKSAIGISIEIIIRYDCQVKHNLARDDIT